MKRTVVCLLILALVLVWPIGAMAAGEETVTTTGGEETVAVKEIHAVEDLQAVANDPDGEAFAAIRVQAPCMESGQAAGFAAAMCVKQGIHVQDVDTEALVAQVRAAGSFV